MIAEIHEIVTSDGVTFALSDGLSRWVLKTPQQMGIPGVEPITLQAGRQGRLYRDFLLQPRELTMDIRYTGCSRSQYWAGRQDLLEVLNPYRGGELSYAIALEDGTEYFVKGVVASNPFANVSEGWDEWGYTETLTIVCNDPIWYSGSTTTTNFTTSAPVQLVFPITFPDVYFSGGGSSGTAQVTYTGTWYSYPVFRLRGAFTSFTLTHVEKGVTIQFIGNFPRTDNYLFIDVGNRLVYDYYGQDYFGLLTGNTNFIDFRLEPDPVVSGGLNTIALSTDALAEDDILYTMTYYNRWIGI